MSEEDAAFIAAAEVGAATCAILLGLPWTAWLAAQDAAEWVQAIGSILAILAGFAGLAIQRGQAERDQREAHRRAALACAQVARSAFLQVGDRLLVAAEPHSKHRRGMALREYRTTELVAALRELKLVEVPDGILSPLAALRSDLYAVNARITEIYASEERASDQNKKRALEARRPSRIKSSLVIYGSAQASYAHLRACLADYLGIALEDALIPPELVALVSANPPSADTSGGWPNEVIERS